ncbi:MAG: hypothetical protein PHX78_10005 [bacterium]|nr:hypothetical protein [bacterium]
MKKNITEKEQIIEKTEDVSVIEENIPEAPHEELMEKETKIFKNLLESRQTDQLYKKYGLTLLYSLDCQDMVGYEKELGIKPQTAVDYYNHGVYSALNKSNNSQAMKYFQKTIEMDNKFSQAHYNMALIYQAGKEDKLAKKELAEFIRLEEERTKFADKEREPAEGQVNYLEEAKKMLKALK